MNAADIRAWDMRLSFLFDYVSDGVQDTWRDWSALALVYKRVSGDCDDKAMTIIGLLTRAGVPLDRLYRLVVVTQPRPGNPGEGHALACVQDDDGVWWNIGDTFSVEPYHSENMEHIPIEYNRMDEAGPDNEPTWREGVPWKANLP